MRFFNNEYKRRRLAAAEAGNGFMSYKVAKQRWSRCSSRRPPHPAKAIQRRSFAGCSGATDHGADLEPEIVVAARRVAKAGDLSALRGGQRVYARVGQTIRASVARIDPEHYPDATETTAGSHVKFAALLDHLIGAKHYRWRYLKAERRGGLRGSRPSRISPETAPEDRLGFRRVECDRHRRLRDARCLPGGLRKKENQTRYSV